MAGKARAAKARVEKPETVLVTPLRMAVIDIRIRGISPLVTHQWAEKGKEQMRKKHAGENKKDRSVRDPEAECEAATYRLPDGRIGVPAVAFKKAMTSATDKDLGLPKTVIRKGLFVRADDAGLIAIDTPGAKLREDVVRVGMGSTDLRYRPVMEEWGATLTLEFDKDLLTADSVINLLNRAGFGVGICEGRPEKDGIWGRFEVVGSAS